jgi:hypothetical protein
VLSVTRCATVVALDDDQLVLDPDQFAWLVQYTAPRRGLHGEVVLLLDELVCAGGAP